MAQDIKQLRKEIKRLTAINDYFYSAAPDWCVEEALELDASLRGVRVCNECGDDTPLRRVTCISCGNKQETNERNRF